MCTGIRDSAGELSWEFMGCTDMSACVQEFMPQLGNGVEMSSTMLICYFHVLGMGKLRLV